LRDKTFIVRLKPRGGAVYPIVANRIEFHDEHLALVHSSGRLAGLFLLDVVESLVQVPDGSERPSLVC
jgi:hypothetical protein